jgi:uncharacterized protein (TIGR00725 family)
MAGLTRLPIVGVIGSAKNDCQERAAAIGCWLAGQDVHLLTGGGPGVMGAVSRAFSEAPHRKGFVIGIIPCAADDQGVTKPTEAKAGYPNEWVEIPIRTHLHKSGKEGEKPESRNHIVALSSAVIIALPGTEGTASEVRLAKEYGRPLIAYLKDRGEIVGLPNDVRVEPDLDKVKAFVLGAIRKLQ